MLRHRSKGMLPLLLLCRDVWLPFVSLELGCKGALCADFWSLLRFVTLWRRGASHPLVEFDRVRRKRPFCLPFGEEEDDGFGGRSSLHVDDVFGHWDINRSYSVYGLSLAFWAKVPGAPSWLLVWIRSKSAVVASTVSILCARKDAVLTVDRLMRLAWYGDSPRRLSLLRCNWYPTSRFGVELRPFKPSWWCINCKSAFDIADISSRLLRVSASNVSSNSGDAWCFRHRQSFQQRLCACSIPRSEVSIPGGETLCAALPSRKMRRSILSSSAVRSSA